jgi:hemoglobin-like flavoprotein
MDKETILLVETSWKNVEVIAPQAAALFYANLFESDPTLKTLFKGDMTEQGKKLMNMISVAVGKLNDLETLLPILQGLAVRHDKYGVNEQDYQTVGNALLKTLEQGLGNAFTADVKNAWAEVYGVMADIMISASAKVA